MPLSFNAGLQQLHSDTMCGLLNTYCLLPFLLI